MQRSKYSSVHRSYTREQIIPHMVNEILGVCRDLGTDRILLDNAWSYCHNRRAHNTHGPFFIDL